MTQVVLDRVQRSDDQHENISAAIPQTSSELYPAPDKLDQVLRGDLILSHERYFRSQLHGMHIRNRILSP